MAHDQASSDTDNAVSLIVKEAYTLGRHNGIARLHRNLLSSLGLNNGAIIELRGRRRIYAKVHELYPTDPEKDIIRLDEILRTNVAVGIGGKVSVMPFEKQIPTAESVVIAPLAAEVMPFISETLLAPQLDSIQVTVGDLLVTWHFRESIIFKVVEVRPLPDNPSNAADKAMAIITRNTKLIVQPKPVARHRQMLWYQSGPGRTN